jgi:peptidyl-prolyl cis-trans isomerase B (cyclophilin B)
MRRLLLPIALVAVLAGCGGEQKASAPPEPKFENGCRVVDAPFPRPDDRKPPAKRLDATKRYSLVVSTNCGTFTIALDQKLAPRTAASLVSLARGGYFDRTIFHRIVPGFVIQGGDPTQTGSGGPGYSTVDKPPANARYTQGVVAMAKTGVEAPGTSGSQFFVVTAPDAGLPPDYAIVGSVTKGLDIVEKIGKLGFENEEPVMTIAIQKITVTVA